MILYRSDWVYELLTNLEFRPPGGAAEGASCKKTFSLRLGLYYKPYLHKTFYRGDRDLCP